MTENVEKKETIPAHTKFDVKILLLTFMEIYLYKGKWHSLSGGLIVSAKLLYYIQSRELQKNIDEI